MPGQYNSITRYHSVSPTLFFGQKGSKGLNSLISWFQHQPRVTLRFGNSEMVRWQPVIRWFHGSSMKADWNSQRTMECVDMFSLSLSPLHLNTVLECPWLEHIWITSSIWFHKTRLPFLQLVTSGDVSSRASSTGFFCFRAAQPPGRLTPIFLFHHESFWLI